MTTLSYVTITEDFDDGSGAPASGYCTFTPSETVYASGVPVVSVDSPITVQVTAGVLGSVELLATDNSGLSYIGQTGFFYWTVQVVVNNITQAPWSFFLPSSPDTVDLFSLANTGAGGGSGTVTSVAVESANGFAGTVADDTTTPQITLSTTVTGLIKGNGTALEEATAGTDYLTPSGSGADLTGITAEQVGADASGAAATAQSNAEAYAESLQPTSESPLALTDGGTGVSAANDAALLSALGAAPLASPAFTGEPTAPTAAALTDSTQVATTAYADSAVAVEKSRAETAEALLAPLASPALTGDPTAPTQATGDDSTKIATDAFVAAAVAALLAGATLTGYLAPAVVALTDGSDIAVDASLGNDFRVTLGGDRTIDAPSNPVDGQDITFLLTQDSAGSRTVTWASGTGGYSFGTAGAPTLTTTAGDADLIGFKYVAALSSWIYLGSSVGFAAA